MSAACHPLLFRSSTELMRVNLSPANPGKAPEEMHLYPFTNLYVCYKLLSTTLLNAKIVQVLN